MPMTSRVVTRDKKSDQPATIKKTNSAGNEESVETKVSSCIVKDKKIQGKVVKNTANNLEQINKTEENSAKAEYLTHHIAIASQKYKYLKQESLDNARLIKK